ncbi:BspA family leucine-rich repeat surface protein [Muricauda oceani]|uniref:BspA family leucine-rich repeat surface protein n=1 Tax=Flagellimonas oceani TaxID=2698672 RepID=A0A6G7J1M6_9FLAO|nr:BspA family leucine-rich repeat surface protein [Allomuricauda oceani]MBW8241225.1 BspA family leucine-rich repeat surface protein [Allomuricauda oceani]QII44771.1 BspA family leucine-rich repeat surface protein [Allomuricauda oceani]
MKKILFSVFAVALLWSCGKDDGPDTPSEDENNVPVIAAQDFSAAETISDTEVIGTVKASDEDGDTLTFTIEANSDDLFEITASGDLSLASGKSLDAAAKEQHNITVKVDDGEDTASATITIKVITVAPTNEVPVMEDQELTVAEDIADTEVIGQVVATDADEDDLTFTMEANDLFMLSESGILTLAEGKSLDYETATSHSITVSVTDGENTAEAKIAILVENIPEADPNDPTAFVTKWETTTPDETIYMGANKNYEYDFTVDWGDGTVETIKELPENHMFEHAYAEPGTHTVAIQGEFPAIKMQSLSVQQLSKLRSLEQWGNIAWQDLSSAFYKCGNMVYNATDAPNLSNVKDLSSMFYAGVASFNGSLNDWDTSTITNMSSMFAQTTFNGDLNWNTSSVTNMSGMFAQAYAFNGDISGWDTGSVIDMQSMFYEANAFNGDITGWDTGNVVIMYGMFNGADAFNRDISVWDVSNVSTMQNMLKNALAFNQNLGGWDIGNVNTMAFMLDNSGMSKENLNATLIGWHSYASLKTAPLNVNLGLNDLTICGLTAIEAKADLMASYGWTFSGNPDEEDACN